MLRSTSRNLELPKKYKVKLTASAQKDLDDIWVFISQNNPLNAIEFLDQIEKRVLGLAIFPERNPIIPEGEVLQAEEYHHTLLKSYRIVYRFDSNNVYVVRIFHGSKLLEIASEE
jgi:toxin ParE1/3/4